MASAGAALPGTARLSSIGCFIGGRVPFFDIGVVAHALGRAHGWVRSRGVTDATADIGRLATESGVRPVELVELGEFSGSAGARGSRWNGRWD